MISSNRGSCDLTLVDPATLLAPRFEADYGGLESPLPEPRTALETVVPRRADGTALLAAPYEAFFLPRDTSALTGNQNLCPSGGEQPAQPWRALVTFPSCDLIAMIELPSGNIVSSARVTAETPEGPFHVADAGTSPSCPVDCGAVDDPDAGAGAGGPGSARPTSVAIFPDGSQAYVSLSSASAVVPMLISEAGIEAQPPLPLPGAGGSDRLRLSVDPYKVQFKGFPGRFVGGDGTDLAFLYVLARDGSIRVVDVVHFPTKECDTNVDPVMLPAEFAPDSACIPVSANVPRRPGSNGPGIRFPSLPVDVAALDVRPVTAADSEATVAGAHAWVLTSSGAVFLVNIAPIRRALTQIAFNPATGKYEPVTKVREPQPFTNTKRDRNQMSYSTALDPTSGPPRVAVPPAISFSGAYVESFWTKGTRANASALTADLLPTPVYFRDPSAAIPQTWTVAWEGPLISGRHGGQLSGDSMLSDGGAGFCNLGVLPGDTVTFNGCITDTQCVPGFVCHQDPTVTEVPGGLEVTGLCVDPKQKSDVSNDQLFRTLRRYEIVEAKQSQLELRPRLDEIVYAELNPCDQQPSGATGGTGDGGATDGGTPDAGATDAGPEDGGVTEAGASDGGGVSRRGPACGNILDPSTSKFECVSDPRWPAAGPAPKRCLDPCTVDDDCRRGRRCDPEIKYCVEAPPLSELGGVLDQIVTYSLNVGASFLVSGGQTGVLTAGKVGTDDVCVPFDADVDGRDPRMIARIPVRTIHDAAGSPLAGISQCPAAVPNNPDDNRTVTETAGACAATPLACVAARTGDACPEQPCLNDIGDRCSCAEGAATVTCAPAPVRCWDERFPLDKLAPAAGNNPCVFLGGPAGADPQPQPKATPKVPAVRHLRALFQNAQISFVLANIDRSAPSGAEIHLDVSGGFRPQAVGYPSSVEVSLPARLVVGPVDSQPQTESSQFEAPYLFVVDRRRLGRAQGGGPTRGQILRIHPFQNGAQVGTVTGFQPLYEDYNRSGGVFPIQ